MVHRIDDSRIGPGEARAEAPRGSGLAHERLLRGSTGASAADGFVSTDDVDLPVGLDGAVVSLMEGLLNRDHRTGRAQGQDASRLLLLLMKAHGNFVYEHCLRLISFSMELARDLGFDEGLEAELEDGLVFRDAGEAAYYLTRQSDDQLAAVTAFLSGVDMAQKSMLHDLGKIQVPDGILYKPGPLSDEETEVMRRHPIWGASILEGIPELAHAIPVTLHHHERWDGTGYPQGLGYEEIPMSARIVSVVDAFDAMTSDRPYRKAMSREEACAEIAERAGTQFDPHVAEVFLRRQGWLR